MNKYIGFLITIFLIGCSGQEDIDRLTRLNNELKEKLFEKEQNMMKREQEISKFQNAYDKLKFLADKTAGFKAIMKTNYGDMKFKFYNEVAPIHVFTFINRAEAGFYNGTKFHRIIKGFMIQGGSPLSKDRINFNDGAGSTLINTPYEVSKIPHKRGTLSTAHVPDPNFSIGEGAQFFVMHNNAPHLDGKYTVFGEMIDGFDVLDKIADMEVYQKNDQKADYTLHMPKKPVILNKVEIVRE